MFGVRDLGKPPAALMSEERWQVRCTADKAIEFWEANSIDEDVREPRDAIERHAKAIYEAAEHIAAIVDTEQFGGGDEGLRIVALLGGHLAPHGARGMTEQKATPPQPSDANLLIWVALQNRKPPTLDTIMPNGKKLGECTGTYCGQLGERLIRVSQGVETGQP